MKKAVEWQGDKCILCLETDKLSEEHIIPAALGGELTCKFLCKFCNEQLGHGFEARAKHAPELRRAALVALGASRSDLIDRLETGTQYISEFGGQHVRQRLRSNRTFGVAKLGDGSVVVPEAEAPKVLKAMLQKRGTSDSEIETALSRWANATSGETVDLIDGLSVKCWQDQRHMPEYSEGPLSPLVPVKIAYEFAALVVGARIYDDIPAFSRIRAILRQSDEAAAQSIVRKRQVSEARGFHGIAFLGNHPHARFQVRLFSQIAFWVDFENLQIKSDKFTYTYDLSDRSHSLRAKPQ